MREERLKITALDVSGIICSPQWQEQLHEQADPGQVELGFQTRAMPAAQLCQETRTALRDVIHHLPSAHRTVFVGWHLCRGLRRVAVGSGARGAPRFCFLRGKSPAWRSCLFGRLIGTGSVAEPTCASEITGAIRDPLNHHCSKWGRTEIQSHGADERERLGCAWQTNPSLHNCLLQPPLW